MFPYIVCLISLIVGFVVGAESCSTVRSFLPFIVRYRKVQAERESAQRAITILASEHRV